MSQYAIRSSLAALGFIVAAAGLSGTAVAATEATPAATHAKQHDGKRGERQHCGHGKHGDHHRGAKMRDGFMVPGVGPLSKEQVESLKLDAKQQAAFGDARQAQREMFKSMRENGGKRHALLNQQLESGKLDPRALTADQDAQRASFREQSEQVRGKWLAAWDSLNAAQHQQVTELVKARQAKVQAHQAKKKERMAERAAQRSEKGGKADANAAGTATN